MARVHQVPMSNRQILATVPLHLLTFRVIHSHPSSSRTRKLIRRLGKPKHKSVHASRRTLGAKGRALRLQRLKHKKRVVVKIDIQPTIRLVKPSPPGRFSPLPFTESGQGTRWPRFPDIKPIIGDPSYDMEGLDFLVSFYM